MSDTHPYCTYKIIPEPESYVSGIISDEQLDLALQRHKARVSKRNSTLFRKRDIKAMKAARIKQSQ